MVNISETDKAKWRKDTSEKKIYITIPNLNTVLTVSDVEWETMSLTESIANSESLDYKGCISNIFKINLMDVMIDLRGQYIEVDMTADNSARLPIFKGYVQKQTNLTHEDVITEITAFDALYKVKDTDVFDWYHALVEGERFPMTLRAFRDGLFEFLEIEQAIDDLPNDGLMLENPTIFTETINAVDVIRWICQANGRFGHMGRDGLFHYIKLESMNDGLYPAIDLYPSEDLYPENGVQSALGFANYESIEHDPYQVAPITYVKIFDEHGNYDGYGANSDNVLCIYDNPIAYGLPIEAAAENIYNEVRNRPYSSAQISTQGMPCIECGDIVTVHSDKTFVQTYVLTRHLQGLQMLMDEYVSTSDELQPQYSDRDNRIATERHQRLEDEDRIVTDFAVETDRIWSTVQSTAQGLRSDIEQTANSLTLSIEDLAGTTRSAIELLPHSISLTVSDHGDSAGIKIEVIDGKGDKQTVSKEITMSGLVRFENLTDGITEIDGGNIRTGTISADKLEAGAVDAGSLTVRDSQTQGVVFHADQDTDYVTIGGFEFNTYQMRTPKTRVDLGRDDLGFPIGVAIQQPKIQIIEDEHGTGYRLLNKWAIAVGYYDFYSYQNARFKVGFDGDAYMDYAEIDTMILDGYRVTMKPKSEVEPNDLVLVAEEL